MKNWFKYYFGYHPIREVQSPISGLVKVVMVLNRPRLIVGNMVQSGGLVRKIWEKAIARLKKKGKKISRVLILGLGCGDCAFEVQKYYPRAEMIGVEIDEHVVDMAKCYFNLATVKNLKIAIGDAAKYVRKLAKKKKPKKFDLILVDVYLGKKMPKEFRSKRFFERLKKLLEKKGVIAYNHLFFKGHKKEAKAFIKELETIFPKIELQRTASNLIIFASNNIDNSG